MRIHELLEECIEYTAVEGVLGADPREVRQHVQTIDPKVDQAYFNHLWTLLAKNNGVQVVIAADALPGVPKVDIPTRTYDELFTVLGQDDGATPPIRSTDLAGLLERYPDRLRIRCTEDEIYYRLTGSRTKISRVTPMIFTYLQLAARAREKGISAIELGPMTNSNQKSVHHYLKGLCQLGLCAKIPASMHGTNTSVLVFRKFLDKNPNYQAHMRPLKAEAEEETEPASHAVAEEGGDTAGEVENLGFDFPPFTQIELAAGHIPKERLLKVLDHPSLKNHLLGNHHLLQVIGWPEDDYNTSHRRQLQRHIATLIQQGIVEYVDIGSAKRACIRLTKYNPDFVPDTTAGPATLSQIEDVKEVEEIKEVSFSADDYDEPFQFHGKAVATRSIESQVLNMIQDSGDEGQTLGVICTTLSNLYKRMLDHIVNRQDLVFLPPHLRHHAVRLVMESYRRQRRLRVFTAEAYHQYLLRLGTPGQPPPDCPEAGHFADLAFRSFAHSLEDYTQEATKLAGPVVPIGKSNKATPKKKGAPKVAAVKAVPDRKGLSRVIPATKPPPKPKKKPVVVEGEEDAKHFKYKNDVQERGRPRKYIYVVNTDGKRNRIVLGELYTKPGLPQVLIYVKDAGVLVPAPPGYTGVGKAPVLTDQQIEDGKPPSFYLEASTSAPSKKPPRKSSGKSKPAARAKSKGKGKGKRTHSDVEKGDQDGEEEDEDEVIEVPPVAGPSKRPRRSTQQAQPPIVLDDTPADVKQLPSIPAEALAPVEEPTQVESSAAPIESVALTPTGRPKRTRNKPETPTAAATLEPPQKKPRRGRASAATLTATGAENDTAQHPMADDGTLPNMNNLASQSKPSGPSGSDVPDNTVLQFFTDAATEMAARSTQTPTKADATAVDRAGASQPTVPGTVPEDEQLLSITDEKPTTPGTSRGNNRIDIAVFRRMNEIVQCLTDLGGVFNEQKLWLEHKEWGHRHAGTSHPHAPPEGGGAGMDRKVFRRTLNKLLDERRIKERNVTTPTSTGRWLNITIIILAEKSDEEINAYIRHLANSAAPPTSLHGRNKAQLEYSAYRRATPRSSLAKPQLTDLGSQQDGAQPGARGGLTPREVYLSEPGMFGYMLGYVSGRAVRAKILHCALVKAMGDNPNADSLVSMSPRILSLPFIFEQLKLKDYLSIYQVMTYDEELFNFCQDPANLDLKLSEIPKSISDTINLTGRGAQSSKSGMRTLLSLLTFFQIVSPLVPTADAAVGTVHITGDHKAHPEHYLSNDDLNVTTAYYIIHDVVPVYNIADQSMSLLGFMEAKEYAQLDQVWGTIKSACLHFHAALPRIAVPPWPFAPRYAGVLTSHMHYYKVLRSIRKWRHDIPLVPGQRAALTAAISPTKALITDPTAIAELADELALPFSYVENFLHRRQHFTEPEVSKPRVLKAKAPGERAVWQSLENHRMTQRQKERMAIRSELAERIAAAKEVHNNRVKALAEAAGISVSPELTDYMTRNRPMNKIGQVATDQELRAVIESFKRVQRGEAPARALPVTRFQPSGARVVKKVQPMSRPPGGACATCQGFKNGDEVTSSIRRHRHNWTKEEDELLFDAETVVRARSRGQTPRGRPALLKIFPFISEQVLRSRLKGMMDQPGKQAYYQRLEDAFWTIIDAHRGSAELPDPNPTSQIDFPLRQWIDFLRPRVNKHLLRLPVSAEPVDPGKPPAPELMTDVPSLVNMFEWTYLQPQVDGYSQILEQPYTGEDARLHYISVQSTTIKDEYRSPQTSNHRQGLARAVLKMIIATEQENYDMQVATNLLSMSKEEYEPQIAALVNEGVLNKNSAFRTPGRMYSFALSWLQASESHLPTEFDKEVDETIQELNEGAMTWPLVGKHGDLGALMTMVSNDEIEFGVAVDEMSMNGFNRLSYVTRSLTDADFECDMSIVRKPQHVSRPLALDPPNPCAFPSLQPWTLATPADPTHVTTVLDAIKVAGAPGLTYYELQANTGLDTNTLDAVLASLPISDPQVFWAGYDNARIISKTHWKDWTVAPDPNADRIAPRRWVDIRGTLILADWERALRCVVGTIMQRPGMTEWDMRDRMKSVMDRLEMTDVLSYLVASGVLERKGIDAERVPPVQATDDADARRIVYMATERMWL